MRYYYFDGKCMIICADGYELIYIFTVSKSLNMSIYQYFNVFQYDLLQYQNLKIFIFFSYQRLII